MLRAIDANLNRAREGLRVLEEVARFALDDAALTACFKGLRHRLAVDDETSNTLLGSRQATKDHAAFLNPLAEMSRRDTNALVLANAKRVQESLRVLEELTKLPGVRLPSNADLYKEIRFAVYQLEKDLIDGLMRREKTARVRGLYVIVDQQMTIGRPLVEVAKAAIAGGASVIQYREKKAGKGLMLAMARELKEVCAASNVLFIVNDHVDVAIAAHADGVHVGQKDLPAAVAREMLPLGMILGCSTAVVAEARKAELDGADYVGVGAMFPTATKDDSRPAGPDILREVKNAVRLPVIAIGGINEGNVRQVVDAGADGVAVISAVVSAPDVAKAARRLCDLMRLDLGEA